MKKIFMMAFAVLLLVMLTGLSPAAQKAITQYSNAAEGMGGPNTIIPIPGMGEPLVTGQGAITTTPIEIDLGGGAHHNDQAGAVWYQGNSDLAFCTTGACNFGQGFRAFFNFQFTTLDSSNGSTNSADGFVFAILNASLNTDASGIPNRTGGAPAACANPSNNCSMGELMGYAGPGNTGAMTPNTGVGLVPPKMGIEFDTYPNGTNGTSNNLCQSNSRNDSPLGTNNVNFRNHIDLLLWGDSPTGYCTLAGINYPKSSFDDNFHGAGLNSSNPGTANPASGYYQGPAQKPGGTYNWLEDGAVHKFRVEIERLKLADATGSYRIKAWVDCNGTSCTTDQATHFQDVVNPYPATDPSPQIDRTVILSPADHTSMDHILFGFTEGTGGATQIAKITNFVIYFPQTAPCIYLLNATTPNPANFTAAGGSGAFSVTGCTGAWAATATSSTPGWLATTSSGTVAGLGAYTVAANASYSTKTGTIAVGPSSGQSFTVTQTGLACPAITSINAIPNATVGTSYSSTLVANGSVAPYTWTASAKPPWMTITTAGQLSGTPTSAGPASVTVSATSSCGTVTPDTTIAFTVNKGTPTVTAWPTASAITLGQALSASTLTGGNASVPGTFAFTAPGFVPTSAGPYSASVTFTPAVPANYNNVVGTVNVTVNKINPTVTTWPTASAITLGQPLSASTLTGGSASVPGSFAFTNPGTIPGTAGTYSASVTFTPTNTTNYNTVVGTVNVTVTQCTYAVTTHACYTGNRIYMNADVTGGTPSSVTWQINGPNGYSNSGTLTQRTPATLYGGTQSGCGLSNAARTGFNSIITSGSYTVRVTATGACNSGNNAVTVTRP